MNKELEKNTMEAQDSTLKEAKSQNLEVKTESDVELKPGLEVSSEASRLEPEATQMLNSEVSEENLNTLLEAARKRPVTLNEVECLMGCACIETLKTFMVVGDRDAEAPVFCVPKTFLLDEHEKPMNPIGFRQIGDMIKTTNLPVNPNARSLFGIWRPPVVDEKADWLERRGRFILTLPRLASHVLNVMPLPTPFAVMHHDDHGDVYWTANEAWDNIPKFGVDGQIYFITEVGYANIGLAPNEDFDERRLFHEQRREKYINLAEQKFCKELVQLRERQQLLDGAAQLEAQRRAELERELPELIQKVKELSEEVDVLCHENPRLTKVLCIYPMQIEAESVQFWDLKYRITAENIENLRERVATAKRQVAQYNDNAVVASKYIEVLQQGDFPVYMKNFYGANSIVPVNKGMPRGLRLKHGKRIVVSLRREDVHIEFYSGADFINLIAAYGYDKPSDIQAFQANMEALMKKMPYRFYKREVKPAFDR